MVDRLLEDGNGRFLENLDRRLLEPIIITFEIRGEKIVYIFSQADVILNL